MLENGTFIQTSGTGYNTTILINSTLDQITVTTNDIIMDDVSFLAIQNVDASAAIINLTGLNNARIIYDNGTRLVISGSISLDISASGRLYIINNRGLILGSGLTTYTRFNENSGLIAFDQSGNANNGTIIGSTWNNDGILITLIRDFDYSVTQSGFITILNQEYIFRFIEVSYIQGNAFIRLITENILNAIITYTDQGKAQLNTVSIAIILIILIGLFSIFWAVFVRPMMNDNNKITSSGRFVS